MLLHKCFGFAPRCANLCPGFRWWTPKGLELRHYQALFSAAFFSLVVAACGAEAPGGESGIEGHSEANIENNRAFQELEAGLETCDLFCSVNNWMDEERYAEAREVLQHELQTVPDDIETVLMLTKVEVADEEYEAAYTLADDTLRGQTDTRLMEQRARASLLNDDVFTAEQDYVELIDELQKPEAPVTTQEAHAWVGLATARYNQGEIEAAELIAKDLLRDSAFADRLDPAYGHFVLALAASKKGQDETALEHYGEILDRYPREPSSLNNVGCVHYRMGDLDKAREYHLAAFEAAGKNRRLAAIAWSNVAEIDMLRGDYKDAEDKLTETLGISKRFAAGHFNLAVLYDLQARPIESARHMKTALEIDMNGVTRWNTSWFTPEWKTHFAALVAESENRTDDAKALWTRLKSADEKVLVRTAARHLAALKK